ncbi:ATP-binding protein [Actinomadura flavalba]|uniref:ATP-binding protein n=1 Tax=Actinomadura flavalba TaxID=1120938 RepID=UPI00036DE751|nr:ATP-binding protein [Actinomadura flavalba]
MKVAPEIAHDRQPGGTAPTAARPGWVWDLPTGPEGAGFARRALDGALTALGVGRDARADARLMVSEIATNAHRHAAGLGPYELWLHDTPDGLRVSVFDRDARVDITGYSWTSGDHGRGLGIVAELSGGRWGVAAARARLGDRAAGKAVWFAVPPG